MSGPVSIPEMFNEQAKQAIMDQAKSLVASAIQVQWTIITNVQIPLFTALATSANKLSASLCKLAETLGELVAAEDEAGEEIETEEIISWPYGGYSLSVTGAECCGYLTCRCEELETELGTMFEAQ